MKKMFLGFAVMIAMVASASVSANSHKNECAAHNHKALAAEVDMQGDHCTGTVGCDCSGFSPITNGDEWQKAYCKRCGHKRSCHK
ncbi:MAG: hypothetical protein Q4E59_03450 [Bacteroidales bacterium]|nr:hypothetical protein [Bacteroidales bacterium]